MGNTLPLLVLIHGAWQGSWAFANWLPELQRSGCQAVAVELPGNGWGPLAEAAASLQSYCAQVLAVIEANEGPVILVGHSGGGITASQVAELVPHRVAAIVYLAGIMLPSGVDLGEIIRLCESENAGSNFDGILPWLDFSGDGTVSTVQQQGALACFVHDCAAEFSLPAVQQLRPQQESGRLMTTTLSSARFGTVPRIYVECSEDRSIFLPLQRKMQALLPGARCIHMQCAHVPQLAQPARLTELLLPVLKELLLKEL